MDLARLILDDATPIRAIAEQLDRCSHEQRWGALSKLDREAQRRLYQKALSSVPLTFEDFVPSELPPLHAVHHVGRNTLPLPQSHRFFEKRFCRPNDSTSRLLGYNHAPSKWLIGPGYFVLMPTVGHAAWEVRGAMVVDYFQVPDGAVVASWPPVIPNTQGLQKFVYQGTRDFMRRVCSHVSIGVAYKGEKCLDHYFVLCREP